MKRKLVLWGGLGAAAIFLAAGAWLVPLPSAPAAAAAPAIAGEETEAAIAALKPPKRPRPLIAIIGINDATETTDYLMPYGILRRADVARRIAVAGEQPPAIALDQALKAISRRYGTRTADFVATQLEYPRQGGIP